mmetsp:Transcript_76107/g.215222  ORF Transcript_76107/g.215222 Transcript_76107/m.215222 type:complete len:240 (-) Transcript_76107:3-722(-)
MIARAYSIVCMEASPVFGVASSGLPSLLDCGDCPPLPAGLLGAEPLLPGLPKMDRAWPKMPSRTPPLLAATVPAPAPSLGFDFEAAGPEDDPRLLTSDWPPGNGAKFRWPLGTSFGIGSFAVSLGLAGFGLWLAPLRLTLVSSSVTACFLRRRSWSWLCDAQFFVKHSWPQNTDVRPRLIHVGQQSRVSMVRPHPWHAIATTSCPTQARSARARARGRGGGGGRVPPRRPWAWKCPEPA